MEFVTFLGRKVPRKLVIYVLPCQSNWQWCFVKSDMNLHSPSVKKAEISTNVKVGNWPNPKKTYWKLNPSPNQSQFSNRFQANFPASFLAGDFPSNRWWKSSSAVWLLISLFPVSVNVPRFRGFILPPQFFHPSHSNDRMTYCVFIIRTNKSDFNMDGWLGS